MEHKKVLIVCVLTYLLSVIVASIIVPPQSSVLAQSRRPFFAIKEVPEKYVENPESLLEDYRNHTIRPETVIQILIFWSIEKEGIFVPFHDTDMYQDHYYINKARHEWLKKDKEKRYQFNGDFEYEQMK